MTNDTLNPSTGRVSTNNTETATSLPPPPALRRAGAHKQTVSMRPFPWLVFIGTVLAAAALPLGFSAPAHAQTLVSNTGRSTVGHTACVRGSNPVIKLDCAQGFKTGENTRGYSLSSIQLDTHTAPGSGTLKVTVWDANGSRPGDELFTLAPPSNIGTGLQTFTAPANTILTRNTRYFVHINFNGSGTRPRWNLATDDRQDSGEAKGWSIGDHRYTRPSGGTGSWEGGSGVYSASIQIKVRGTTLPPAAPNLSAAPGETRVTLAWANPANNTITKYQYRRKTGNGTYGNWTDIPGSGASTTAYTVTGLTSSTAYTFQVWAKNVGGNGEATAVTAATLPAAPTNLWPDPGDGAVTLSWTNPGGDTITRYQVSTDGGENFADIDGSNAGTTEHTVPGLDNGTGYTFKLRARNASGPGRASTVTATPRAPPAAPAGLSATAGVGQVTLSWSNPGDNTILKYQYRVSDDLGVTWDPNWTDSSGSNWTTYTYTVTGLSNGTQYTLALRAVNAIDEGPASTKNATPLWGAPANLSATPFIDPDTDESQVILSWTDPGDSTIAKYQVSTDGGETFDNISGSSATTTSYAVTGLTNGTEYTLALRAANASAHGAAASATARPLWPAPANLEALPGNEKVELKWDTGDDLIKDYRVHWQATNSGATLMSSDVEAGSGETTTTTITGLTNGTEYTFTVQAVDTSVSPAVITGLPSSTTATPKPVPATPDLSAAAGSQQVTLTWTYPDDSSITKYRYRQKVGAATFGDWIDIAGSGADTIEHTVPGLTNGTEYTFVLRAVNDAGESLLSDDKTATPLWPAPVVTAAPDSGRVVLQWDTGDPGIARYAVRTTLTGTNTQVSDNAHESGSGNKTTVPVGGLTDGTNYTFTVRAASGTFTNFQITGAASTATATPALALPAAPTGLTPTADDSQVRLVWGDPGNITITRYDYSTYSAQGYPSEILGSNAATTAYTVIILSDGGGITLSNNTAYPFAVRAVNASGDGPWATVTATPIGPPSAPGGLSATEGDHQQTTLSWANPSDSTILNYEYRQAHAPNPANIVFGEWSEWKDIGGSDKTTIRHTVTGLFSGFLYKFEVRAVNDSGKGGVAEETATPLWPAPVVTATPDDGRVWLQWDTWFEVEEYVIGVSPGASYDFGPEELTGPVKTGPGNLSNGTLYTFTVKAWGWPDPDATDPKIVPLSKIATVTARPVAPATPAAPTNLSATPGDSRVVLKWDDPGNPTITGYEYTTDGGTTVISIGDSDADTTQDTVDDLTNNTAYTFAVRATNASGDSPWSNSATATPIAVPNAPGNLSAAPGDGRVALSWVKPSNDAPIGSYEVSTDGGDNYSAIADSDDETTAHTVMGLINGTEYTLALRAANSAGKGLAATVTATPMAAPAAPTNLLAAAGATEVALTWDDPDDDTITGYKVSTDGGETFADIEGTDISENDTDNTLAYTVTGLINGTEYTFELRAVNTYGEGAAATVTAPTLPAAPTDFMAEGGEDRQVTLSWDDPDNNTVSGYQYSTDGGTNFTDIASVDISEGDMGNTLKYTVTGLTNGTEYTFKLRAVNLSGAGAASLEATATPLWPAPDNLAAAPGDGQVTLTWDRGDSGITRYKVSTTYTSTGGTYSNTVLSAGSGDQTTLLIPGLTNRTDYTFTVQAVDTSGDDTVIIGRPSSVTATPVPVPAAPNLSATAGNGQAVLTWDDPNDSSITKYQVRSKVKDSDDSTYTAWANIAVTDPAAPPTGYTVTDLTNGTEYTFKLRAVNGTGNGVASTADATPIAIPNAPENLRATPAAGRVALAWDQPSNDVTIDNYEVSIDSGAFTAIAGSSAATTTYTVTGLTNGTQYRLAVRAVNAKGEGPASTVTARPIAPPARPDLQMPKPGYRKVALEWVNPNDSTITRYEVSTDGGTNFTDIDDTDTGIVENNTDNTLTHTVTHLSGDPATRLSNGITYMLELRAVNDVGEGDPSVANATPVNTPPTASPGEVSTNENTAYPFRVKDFAFMDDDDDDDALDHVKITSLPDQGTLWLDIDVDGGVDGDGDGDDVITSDDLDQEVTSTQLGEGKLKYTPPENAHGEPFATFEFKVSDGESDSVAYAMAINVVRVYSVRFGAAAYAVEEGGDPVRVTVTLSKQAAAALEIPITVTPQGRTVPADYEVEDLEVDGKLAFEVGDTTRSFTIEATEEAQQDDNFHDVRVALGFGDLPTDVAKGAPARATLTIVDAEGAVVRARFRRLNAEILSKHALTLADVTIAAVTSRQEAGPRCADQANTGSLGGQSSLAEILTANAQTLTTGSLNLKQLLGTSAFRLRLTDDGSGAGPGCLTLWGQGDYRNLSSSDARGLEWDGDLVTGQVGADALLQPDLRAGLAVSWSEGDFDYTDRTDGDPFSGDYTSRMMSVHPYLTWWSPAGLDVWATGGYGQGEIEIKDEEAGTHTSDTTLRLASVGASGLLPIGDALIAGGTTTLRVKAQASVAQMKVEGNGSLLEEQTIEAQRLRLALEGSHERTLASGGSLTPSFEVGLRHDGGDGATGTGLELGGGLRYVAPALGLTVEGRGRVLAAYEEDYEEWGASGLIRLDPGLDRQGLSFSLVPSYGQTASGVQRLWDQGLTQGSTQGPSATQAPTGRLEAEVGYGLVAFAGQGLVTPYSAVILGGGTQQYRVGSRLELGPALRLSLEGTRQVTTVGQADQGIRLQVDWQF